MKEEESGTKERKTQAEQRKQMSYHILDIELSVFM